MSGFDASGRLFGAAEVRLGRQRSPQHESGPHMTRYLRAANVKDGKLDLVDVKEMNFAPAEQKIFGLRPGDVLVTEGSGSLTSVGATAVWNGEIEDTVCFQNTLVRLRPRPGITDARYLGWWARAAYASGQFAAIASGANIYHLSSERIKGLPVRLPSLDEQQRIADFLTAETGRIDSLITFQRRVLRLMEERIDNQILDLVGKSKLAAPCGTPAVPLRRLLAKCNRPTKATNELITAFRDGQVTSRSKRRNDGFTLSESVEPQGQGVEIGDVVIHGLDGFAGAIGDAESAGNCSAVYHVCTPLNGGNPAFYGRMLRVLAIDNYLGLFATSTRERAVDFRKWDLLGRIPVPQVNLDMQQSIGNSVTSIRPLRQEIDRFIERLTERRQTLITAAVAGQIDVATARWLPDSGGVKV
jgi:type I restriction enzyme S subunit